MNTASVGIYLAATFALTAPLRAVEPVAAATVKRYCVQCHGQAAMGGVNLEKLLAEPSVGPGFRTWQKAALAIEQKRMPPAKLPQLTDAERSQVVTSLRTQLSAYAKLHDGEPGRVTMRRLTSGEYRYAVSDLTGVDLDAGIGASSDSAGGEGFTNFGDVQFMQDANVERYLEAAKRVADHAVIGSGPLAFFTDPGKTGFEMSAIARIRDIHRQYGFRTVSGEGGIPFGLEKYGKAFFVAWNYKYRAALGQPNVTLKELAAKEGLTTRFAEHIWKVVNTSTLGYPSSEAVKKWQAIGAPAADRAAAVKTARAQSDDVQKFIVTWASWLFARGDVAAGGAGDESPLQFDDRTLAVKPSHHFVYNTGARVRGPAIPTGPKKIYLHLAAVNPAPGSKPVVIWHNPTIAVRKGGRRPGGPDAAPTPPPPSPTGAGAGADAKPVEVAGGLKGVPAAGQKVPLRMVVDEATAKRLNFGVSPDGTPIGPDDFAAEGTVMFQVTVPEGAFGVEFQADAQVGKDRDQVFRLLISEREDGGSRGIPIRALIGDPASAGYKRFKSGVMEYATVLPPNSHGEAAPADKDPVPLPFDSAFNVPEHDEFLLKVKYVRDDRFVTENLVDDAMRTRLNQAWADLYASFDYHENYLRMLAQHYKYDLKGIKLATLTKAQLESFPAEMRPFVPPLVSAYQEAQAAQAAGRAGHVEDCVRLASRAWRRPLTASEKVELRGFYARIYATEKDHKKAIRALIARILVAPQFLYRVEQADAGSPFRNASMATTATVKPLTNYELASRISFFLWASIPDDELMRAAAANELSTTAGLQKQVKRMLADEKARRLATEFFGQWLGFYHFDEHRGVDTSRFPEFNDDVKEGMYDEAISFFTHIVRQNRPVSDLLHADYTFLNQPLAKFYGVNKPVKSKDQVELVEGANAFQRGGVLRLGAVLTATSAPLRTSPVKRGDWLLRRILGTEVPPPPANAGVLPADDKNFGGMTLRQKLEAHKRNATCASCHSRIDPLGFPLERYDSIGRYRTKYADGNPVDDEGVLTDKTQIAGIDGLLKYLKTQDQQVLRTVAFKMTGYALGRTVQPSDEVLIEKMSQLGGSATVADLATAIVASKQFRHRLVNDNSPAAPATKPALAAARNNSNSAGGQ